MANRIKGITISIDGDTKGLDKALKSVTDESINVSRELKDVNKLLKLNPDNVELVSQKQQLLSKAVETTSEKLGALKKAQQQVDEQFKNGDIGEEQYRDFQREIVATEGSLKGYKNQLSNLSGEQKSLSTNTERLKNYFTATKTSVEDYSSVLGSRLTNAIKNGTASSEQMQTALQKIAREAGISAQDLGKLEESLDGVDKNANGISNVKSKIDELGNSSGKTSRDVKGLGDSGDQAASKFENFKKTFSFGTVFSMAQSVFQSVKNSLTDLGKEAMTDSDSLDKFKSTMKFSGAGNAEIKKTTAEMKKYADDTVYDLGTVSNTTAQLASNGINNYEGLTEAAGNLNAVAGGNQDTFSSVAMVLTQTAGAGKLTTENWNQLADAIPGASGKLQEAMKKNGDYTGNFRDAMEKGEITSDEFNKAIMQLGNKPVAVEAAKSTKTFEGAIGNLQAGAETAIMKIIDSFGKKNLTDSINKLGDVTVKALNQVKKVIDFVKSNSGAFKALSVGILATVGAFKAMQAINAIVQTMKTFNSITKIGTGIQVAFNAVMGMNPYILIAAAIAGVVAGLVYFFTQTKAGQKIVQSVTKAIQVAWQSVKDFLVPLFTSIGENAKNIWNGMVNIVTNVVNAIKNAWNSMVSVVKNVVTTIKNVFQLGFMTVVSVIQGIWLIITSIFKAYLNIWKAIFTAISDAFKAVWTKMWAFISPILSAIGNVITNAFNAIVDTIKGVWTKLQAFISPILSAIGNTVSNAFRGMVITVQNVLSPIVSFVSNAWNNVKSVTSSILNSVKSVVSSVWNNIKSVISTVANSVKSVVSSAWNGVKSVTSSVMNAVKSVVSNIWNGIKSTITNVVNAVKSVVSSGWNAIKSVTSSVWNGIKSAMVTPVQAAKSTISGIVSAIKGFFSNMHLRIPKISLPAMPHFSISGGFDLKKMTVPHLNVKWYAKGAIFKKPTLFDGPTGVSGAGEAGPEAMLPLNKSTLSMIGDQISKNMKNVQMPNITINVTGGNGTPTDISQAVADAMQNIFRQQFNNTSDAFGGGSIA